MRRSRNHELGYFGSLADPLVVVADTKCGPARSHDHFTYWVLYIFVGTCPAPSWEDSLQTFESELMDTDALSCIH